MPPDASRSSRFQTGEVWYSWPSVIEDNRLTFSYDAAGQQLTARDGDGAYTLTYDAVGRVATSVDPWGKVLTMTYDAAGNRTQLQDSDGGTTDSTFDAPVNDAPVAQDDAYLGVLAINVSPKGGLIMKMIRGASRRGTELAADGLFGGEGAGQVCRLGHEARAARCLSAAAADLRRLRTSHRPALQAVPLLHRGEGVAAA